MINACLKSFAGVVFFLFGCDNSKEKKVIGWRRNRWLVEFSEMNKFSIISSVQMSEKVENADPKRISIFFLCPICDTIIGSTNLKGGIVLKYVKQFGIIIFLSFIGEIFHEVLPLPVPASIYGIVLLFVCLELKVIKVSSIKEASVFLIEIMPLMFIPAAVKLINVWDIIKDAWIPYLVVTVLTTWVVMGVSGIVTQRVIRKKNETEEKEG